MAEPPVEDKPHFHVHLKLNGDYQPSKIQSIHSIPNINVPSNVTALEFPADMSASSSSSSPSPRSPPNSPTIPVNGGREGSPRFENLATGGFYFDRSPPARIKIHGLVRGSPPRRDMPLNIKDYQDNVLAARNHRIYAIDELSEVSGRSDLVALHERMRMEQVHEILANQERQARRDRPTSRRPVKEVKVSSIRTTSPSPADSPPYGADSPLQSNRVSFRKCRILIPPNQANSTDDQLYSQAFDAFIFDLDLATINPSTASLSLSQFPSRRNSHHNSQHQSNRISRHSSDRMNSGYLTGNSRIPSRSEAVPQKSNSSCCACFGLGGKGSGRSSKNDNRSDHARGGSIGRETGRQSGSDRDRLI